MTKIFKLFLTLFVAVGLSAGCDDDREVLMVNPGDGSGNTGGVVDTPNGGGDDSNDENTDSGNDSGNDNTGDDDDTSDMKYDSKSFVGFWEITIVDWDDTYYLKLDDAGNYYESIESDGDFYNAGKYIVSGNVFSIPKGSGVSNGYGTNFVIESVSDDYIFMHCDDINTYKIVMKRLPESDEGGDDNEESVGGFSENINGLVVTWASDVTTEQKEVVTALVQNMVYVEGGTFMMGANPGNSEAYSNEEPRHSVTLSGYRIGKYEVTQREWLAVMGSNPSNFKGDNLPVESVSWNDCQAFVQKLNNMTGLSFRLPTEAEWEFAARGGNRSIGYKYSGRDNIGSVAWYDGNSGSTTHPVGQKQGNELGLYDMSGNVYEWCSDWYDSYTSSSQTNPHGPSSGSDRVSRGGCWSRSARFCRVSQRGLGIPSGSSNGLGLRLALSVDDSGNDEQGGDIDDSIVYDESDFVGVWEATVVDWDDIYYLRFDKFGNYYETYSKDTDFSLSGQYSVSDNVLSIPYGCGVANGYGTDYIIESVAENSITLKSCDFGDNVIMHKQPDSFEPPMFAMWGEDLQTVGYDEALVTFEWETNCTVGEPMIDAEWVTLNRQIATGARFVVAAFNLPCDSTRIATISIPYTSAAGEAFTQELTICQTGKFYFGPADIIGSWSMFMKGTDVSQKADYNFNADGTFTSTSYTISNETGEIMIDEVTGEPMIPIVDEGVYIISEKTEANVKEDALFNIQIGEGGLTFEVLYNFQTLQMTCYLEISQTNPDGSKEILSEISQVYSRK